jgi:hypothetical protein
VKLPAILASSLFMLAGTALAKECRIPDPKPGQPIQVPAECKDSIRSKPQKSDALKSKEGVIDLGQGTTLQIGGRVRAEMGLQR